MIVVEKPDFFTVYFCPSAVSNNFYCSFGHSSRFFFPFYSSIVFSHSFLIFLVSVHSSSCSQSVKFNSANLFFKWTLNPSGMLFTRYFATAILSLLFLGCTLTFDVSSPWSAPRSVPGLVLAERTQLLHVLHAITQSIWLPDRPSGDVHVHSHLCGCLKHVFVMNKLLASQKSMNRSPASFVTSSTNFPMMLDSVLFPTFASQSPIITSTSCSAVWSFFSWILA